MKELDEMTIYEVLDYIQDTTSPSFLAEYLWMNYPKYAEDLMEEIEARLYLDTLKGD